VVLSGKQVVLTLEGSGTLTTMAVEAKATFQLDIRTLGMSAPRFLMFKMEEGAP